MKLVHSFLFILLLSSIAYCQKKTFDQNDVMIKYDYKKRKYGLKNKTGKKIIPPKYDDIKYFADEQVALTENKLKWSFILLPKKQKIPLSYDNVTHFNGPLFIVSKNKKYGVIDKYGKEVFPPSLDKIHNLIYGLAITENDNYYGLLNSSGKIVYHTKYESINIINDSVFITKLNNKLGLFSSNGNEIIPPTYDNIQLLDENSYRILLNNKYGVMDKNSTISIEPQFDNIYSFNENLYGVLNNNKYGLIKKEGKELTEAKYDQILYNDVDVAYAYLNGDKGTISLLDGKFTKIIDTPASIGVDSNDFRVFDTVEVESKYPGGINALRNFVAAHVSYPELAIKNGTQGRVMAKFVIEKDGTISNIKIIKDIGDGCGKEVIRVLELTKKWEPAMINGKPVRTYFRFPIVFKLP